MDRELGRRLVELRTHLGITQEEFARKIKVSKSYITSLEGCQRVLNPRIIRLIAYTFGVNEKWLQTGKGRMLKEQKDVVLEEVITLYKQMLDWTVTDEGLVKVSGFRWLRLFPNNTAGIDVSGYTAVCYEIAEKDWTAWDSYLMALFCFDNSNIENQFQIVANTSGDNSTDAAVYDPATGIFTVPFASKPRNLSNNLIRLGLNTSARSGPITIKKIWLVKNTGEDSQQADPLVIFEDGSFNPTILSYDLQNRKLQKLILEQLKVLLDLYKLSINES